jgi:hypothetical protein
MSEILNLQTLPIAEPDHAAPFWSSMSSGLQCPIPVASD